MTFSKVRSEKNFVCCEEVMAAGTELPPEYCHSSMYAVHNSLGLSLYFGLSASAMMRSLSEMGMYSRVNVMPSISYDFRVRYRGSSRVVGLHRSRY